MRHQLLPRGIVRIGIYEDLRVVNRSSSHSFNLQSTVISDQSNFILLYFNHDALSYSYSRFGHPQCRPRHFVTNLNVRSAGDTMKAVCGQQVTNNLQSNEYGDNQQLSQIGASQKLQCLYLRREHVQRLTIWRFRLSREVRWYPSQSTFKPSMQ